MNRRHIHRQKAHNLQLTVDQLMSAALALIDFSPNLKSQHLGIKFKIEWSEITLESISNRENSDWSSVHVLNGQAGRLDRQ